MILADARNIRRLRQLDMRQSVELSRYAIGRACRFQGVKHGRERSVADDMHVKCESGKVKALDEFHDDGAIVLQLAVGDRALPWMEVVYSREFRYRRRGGVLR